MATIKEIAEAVGVSIGTVSRVLNYDQTLSISAKKRRAIIEVAEQMNYMTPRRRNAEEAAELSSVALVHLLKPEKELADPYYVALRMGIERRCAELHAEVIKVYRNVARPDGRALSQASGVIAIGTQSVDDIAWLRKHAQNLVFADTMADVPRSDSICADLKGPMVEMLAALVAKGRRRFGYVGVDELRGQAFREFLEDKGLFDPDLFVVCDISEEDGHRVTLDLMSRNLPPDAIVAFNDTIAIGVYRALHQLAVSIPGQVSVVSFNDIQVAQYLSPPLTTVRLPTEEIGVTAVNLLIERVGGRDLDKRISLVPTVEWRLSH